LDTYLVSDRTGYTGWKCRHSESCPDHLDAVWFRLTAFSDCAYSYTCIQRASWLLSLRLSLYRHPMFTTACTSGRVLHPNLVASESVKTRKDDAVDVQAPRTHLQTSRPPILP